MSWKNARTDKYISTLFGNAGNFGKSKKEGIGRDILHKFLGGNFKQWMIQSALETLSEHKEKVIDRAAVEAMPKLEKANRFRRAIKQHKIPIKSQKGLARQLIKDEVPSREIPARVADVAKKQHGKRGSFATWRVESRAWSGESEAWSVESRAWSGEGLHGKRGSFATWRVESRAWSVKRGE